MHGEVRAIVEKVVEQFSEHAAGQVLDIGSRRFHSQWCPRNLFPNYTGVDFIKGENVDRVCNAHSLPFDPDSYDLVMMLNFLEHDADPTASVGEAIRVLRPGGLLVVSAAGPGTAPHEEKSAGGHYANIEPADLAKWTSELAEEKGFAGRKTDTVFVGFKRE